MKEKAIFAAGCFWGVQTYFDQIPGVVETTVGYTGGHTINPTYAQVVSHATGHAESIEVLFDDTVVPYRSLLQHFFRMHDPTQLNRQGPDFGDQYRSAIFYTSDRQKAEAKAVIKHMQDEHVYKKPIVTEVLEAGTFYAAEDYHQKYFEKTGMGSCHIAYAPLA